MPFDDIRVLDAAALVAAPFTISSPGRRPASCAGRIAASTIREQDQ